MVHAADKTSPFHMQASPTVLISIVVAALFLAVRGAVLLLTVRILCTMLAAAQQLPLTGSE